jgi:RNA polymerase subunit RPABC4/transcription elongation factor Spt4
MFSCQECGRKFKTAKATCPKCGGSDVDLDTPKYSGLHPVNDTEFVQKEIEQNQRDLEAIN